MNDADWQSVYARSARPRASLLPPLLLHTLLLHTLLLQCLLLIAAQVCRADGAPDDRLVLIGAQLAPYSYEVDGQVLGLGADIYRELARRVGHSGNIRIMPFKRGFLSVQNQVNLLMSPVARVPQREGQVTWAIHYLNDAFFYVTRSGEPGLTHAEARKSARIGVLRGSAPLAQLQENGVTNYREQTTDSVNLKLLQAGRIDAWFTSAVLFSGALKANPEVTITDFVIGDVQSSHCVYIVASNRVDRELIRPWIEAFGAMKNDGTLAEILHHYLDDAFNADTGLLGRLDVQESDTCGTYDGRSSAWQITATSP